MAIRRKDDQSLVVIYVCRHTVPAVGTINSIGPCPENRVPDCLMAFWSLSWLRDTARSDRQKDWDARWGNHSREKRSSKTLTVKACRISGQIGDSCTEHNGQCIETYIASSFIAGYAIGRHRWRVFRDELVNDQLPVLLVAAAPPECA